MKSAKLYQGYFSNFISQDDDNLFVPLPILHSEQLDDLAVDNKGESIIRYVNYSLQLSASHKFPFYTASNIDGTLFKKVPRKDNWRKDSRLSPDLQWGKELYGAAKSDFDRGHMTKREDVQWGATIGLALNAADSTFYYTNSVPQHPDLNQEIWRSLEDYILHTETTTNALKICVFTGPVLSNSNPYFVTPINGNLIQIPILFWKVVVFTKGDGKLYRVGFMMSQNQLLLQNGIVSELETESVDSQLFMQFDDAQTYQVNISLIERLSGLQMPKAIDSYTDHRSTKLILEEIDIDPELESESIEYQIGFIIQNITL